MADPNLSIANPVPQIAALPSINDSALPATATPGAAATPAVPSAPTITTPAATTPDPVAAAADQAAASQDEFASAWKTAMEEPLTPVNNGGLTLTDEAKTLETNLGAKAASQTPLTSQDEYTQAWLREQRGDYGDIYGQAAPTDTVAPPPAAAPVVEITDQDRLLWQRGDLVGNPGDPESLAAMAARNGMSPEKIALLKEEATTEFKAQSEFEDRLAKRQAKLDASLGA